MKKLSQTTKYESTARLSKKLCIPQNVFAGAFQVKVFDNSELWIENYKGIIEYLPEKITIQGKNKRITILGKHLQISYYSEAECGIYGVIDTIKYND